ncbi:AAA family ATPase [Streptomyces sp. NPDC040724]|uniref:AAA family ATPase n=1 Tax=Streptomyces sp. NPDC040724 TaxID=3155612 RepID=UPI0033C0D246
MRAAARVALFRQAHPAAAELAQACSLAVRVEPPLLRNLRLLLPHADVAAEADLWFSDLLSARDVTAIVLEPPVAEVLRRELSAPGHARLLHDAWELIRSAHRGAHWSVRLEEQVHYLDTARPPGAREAIEQLLLAGLEELNGEHDPAAGVARWLLGAVGRLPSDLACTQVPRVAKVAAGARLDGRAEQVTDLTAAEAEAWLPWHLRSLPTTTLSVQLLDGAVVLGGDPGPQAVLLDGIPETDPLVVEVRWQDGGRAVSLQVAVRPDEPVQVETGTDSVTLVALSGLAFRLHRQDERESRFDRGGLRHDAVKVALRPCLGRREELDRLREALADPPLDGGWVVVHGPQGMGKSVLLVAAADEQPRRGVAVIEHFYGSGPPERDDPDVVAESLLAQLAAEYRRLPNTAAEGPIQSAGEAGAAERSPQLLLGRRLRELAETDAFDVRPLVVLIDGCHTSGDDLADLEPPPPLPVRPPEGVRYAVGVRSDIPPGFRQGRASRGLRWRNITGSRQSDYEVCTAMLARDRTGLVKAFGGAVPDDDLVTLTNGLPGRLAGLIAWALRQPPGTAAVEAVPPSLTTRWQQVLEQPSPRGTGVPWLIWLYLVVAADGLNTWADCADAVRSARATGPWQELMDQCVAERLVDPPISDGVVRLSDISVSERLRELDRGGDELRRAHRRLALPPESGRSMEPDRRPLRTERTTPTWRATAVRHALAASEPELAMEVCLSLRYLRVRYADDPAALTADLAAVVASTGDPRVESLRQSVHALANARVAPAAFAARLHDRLRAHTTDGEWIDGVFWEALARTPLRVTRHLDDEALRGATLTRREHGPFLACAMTPDGLTTLLGPDTLRSLDEPDAVPLPVRSVNGAVAGPAGSFAAWSDQELVVTGKEPPMLLDLPSLVVVPGRPGVVDFAARLPSAVVLATPEGTVRHYTWDGTPGPGGWRRRLLVGHGARVTEAADGELLLTASEDGTIRLWDAGRDRARICAAHRGAVRCAAYLPDRRTFVSGGDDGDVLRWDVGRRSPIARWAGHVGPVLALAVLADGRVVSASADTTLRVWGLTGTEPLVLTGHEDAVAGCLETDSGILSWSSDGTVRLWSARGGPAWHVARGFPGGIRSVTAARGTYAVLCGDGSVERRVLPTSPSDVRAGLGALAIRGTDVLVGLDYLLGVFDRHGVAGDPHRLSVEPVALAAAPDRDEVILLDHSGGLWNVDAFGSAGLLPSPAQPLPERLVRLAGGRIVTSAGPEVRVTDLAGSPIAVTELPERVTALGAAELEPALGMGVGVAVGTAAGNVFLLDPATAAAARTITVSASAVTAVTVAGGDRMVTGSADGTVCVVPLDSARPGEARPGHDGPVTAVASAGPWVVSGGRDGRLLLWHDASPKPVHVVELDSAVETLAIAPDGTWLAARDAAGGLWLLELATPGSLRSTDLVGLLPPAGGTVVEITGEGETPYEALIVRHLLAVREDFELRAATIRVGGAELPASVSIGDTNAPGKEWATVEPDGALRLPLWVEAGETAVFWLRTPWGEGAIPAGEITFDLWLASPNLDGRVGVVRPPSGRPASA